jgi:hypothetical protein
MVVSHSNGAHVIDCAENASHLWSHYEHTLSHNSAQSERNITIALEASGRESVGCTTPQ